MNAFDILKSIDWPSTIVVVDFESYFDPSYTLTKLGTLEYICDRRFETQVVGYCSAPGCAEVVPEWNYAELKQLKNEDVVWSMHNAFFDASILALIYGIHPKYMIDTKLLAAHLWPAASHSLKDVAAQLGLPAKGDTLSFLGKRYATMTPAEQKAYIDYTKRDVELQYAIGMKLLPLVDNPAVELPTMQHTIELLTRPVLRFDAAKANEIRKGMIDDEANAVAKTGCTVEQISGNRSFEKLMVQALTSAGDDPKKYFKPMKKGDALAIAKDDEEREELLKHPNERVRLLMNARVAKRSWPLHLKRIDRIESLAKCGDGLLGIPLNYYGCVTGRPSGAMKVNLLNLPKRGHPLLLKMREMLASQPGHKVVSIDLNAIEARITAWIAGQTDLIAGFEKNIDVYSDFASSFFQRTVYNPADDELPVVAKQMSKLRDFGKVCILGMGYGMGPDRFSDYANCDCTTAEKAVDFYRRKYPAIPQLWYDLQEEFWYGNVKGHKLAIESGWNGPASRLIRLPSGRCIRYPEVIGDKQDMAIRWGPKEALRIWGGHLVENVSQGIARCILSEAILRIEKRGFHVCHHIYDQLLLHVEDAKAQECVAVATEEVTRCPAWALDLPLAAKAKVRDYYVAD